MTHRGGSREGGFRSGGDRGASREGGFRSGDRDSRGGSREGGFRRDDRPRDEHRGGSREGGFGGGDRDFRRDRDAAPDRAPRDDRGGRREAETAPLKPTLADDILATDLDTSVRAELLSLTKAVAESVARHLVATGKLLDEEPAEALAHALAARRLASRIAVVREAVGLAAYHAGEWQTAIAELRTYHRMSGRQTHLGGARRL